MEKQFKIDPKAMQRATLTITQQNALSLFFGTGEKTTF
jgi:hypothetical protein